jgi:hypothetical protein
MLIERRIKASIVGTKSADVFLRSQFEKMGSEAQVGRALRKLVEDGLIVRLGVGVYAKAKRSVLSGNPIPVQPIEILAEQALRKMGIQVRPSSQVIRYNAGKSTQVPTQPMINIGSRRIVRKLSFGSRTVQYENNTR